MANRSLLYLPLSLKKRTSSDSVEPNEHTPATADPSTNEQQLPTLDMFPGTPSFTASQTRCTLRDVHETLKMAVDTALIADCYPPHLVNNMQAAFPDRAAIIAEFGKIKQHADLAQLAVMRTMNYIAVLRPELIKEAKECTDPVTPVTWERLPTYKRLEVALKKVAARWEQLLKIEGMGLHWMKEEVLLSKAWQEGTCEARMLGSWSAAFQ